MLIKWKIKFQNSVKILLTTFKKIYFNAVSVVKCKAFGVKSRRIYYAWGIIIIIHFFPYGYATELFQGLSKDSWRSLKTTCSGQSALTVDLKEKCFRLEISATTTKR